MNMGNNTGKKKTFIWLFGENRGESANNNSFYMWKHVLKKEDDIEKYLIMRKNENNLKVYHNLNSKEKQFVICKDSPKHLKFYLDSDMYFITLGINDIRPEYIFGKRIKLEVKAPVIRLGHGNLAIKKIGYSGQSYNNNLIRSLYFNPMIKETLMEQNDFKSYQLYYSDYLPRYQELFKREQNKDPHNTLNILWFLTWREYFAEPSLANIFISNTLNLFYDKRMEAYIKENNVKVTLCVHQFFDAETMSKYQNQFDKLGVEVKYGNQTDVMDEIVNNDVLITDYSSLGFDFTVLGKPVILYQPDLETYLQERELYCDLEELKANSVRKGKDLVDRLIHEEYGVNPFFVDRSVKNVDREYVIQGKHIDKIYSDISDLQHKKVTFIGYNFYGEGGTVFATRALAEALMEQGYLVELMSMRKSQQAYNVPYGICMKNQYNSLTNRKIDRLHKMQGKVLRTYKYMNYDKNRKNLIPYAERHLVHDLQNSNSVAVISTRESLHLMLKDIVNPNIKEKIYFYHCPAEIFDTNFPGAMDRLKKITLEKAVFVTENNKKLYEERYGLNNFKESLVLGNALDSFRSVETNDIHCIQRKEKYKGLYLVRVDSSRKKDLDNLLSYARYIRDHHIDDIKIDIYGYGDYIGEFLRIIGEEELTEIIECKGLTRDVKETMKEYDAITDFSLNHSFGMPYIEGVLNGKKVYCMKNVGAEEVMREIPNTYITSPEDFVEKMRNLPNVTKEELVQNYDMIARKYSRNAIAEKFIEFMEERAE